ncbi:MAG: ABC transporter ATP-binding protein [Candidatus Thorarchaeota archaeon]|nr:ABC transporter ATP-binding protein [Candidatus Thorarchaeota archaeon]
MLEARDLVFSYEGTQPILEKVTMQLHPREIVLLTGPTGSGKSTLAKCLSGFIPRMIKGDYSGSVFIENKDVSDLLLSEYAEKVALVQQDPDGQICTLNVGDEVAFGPENYCKDTKEIERLVESSLSSVSSWHLRNRSTHKLSGGEKQRIIIAAMLASEPDYLILDESSSSLDPKGTLELRDVLVAMKENNLGILCIEHQLSAFLPIADRILQISEGKVIETPQNKTFSADIPQKSSGMIRIENPEEVIRIENTTFSYGKQIAVNQVSLILNRGDFVALMGDNGSGKTTLLSMIAGLLEPSIGKVFLNRKSISSFAKREIAKRIGVVFQNPNHQIFERTVWKEQVLGLEVLEYDMEENLDNAKNVLDAMGLSPYSERNPFSLSHGQKRRLNVSSVTLHEPEVYLFDEPFIGQDADGRRIIAEKMTRRVETGGICVVVTHDPTFAREFCNRILFMENGSILLDGSPQAVQDRLQEIGKPEYTAQGGQSE